MKQFNKSMNQKKYYFLIGTSILLMISGLVVVIPRYDGLQVRLIIHAVLVGLLAVGLLLYPRYEGYLFRILMIILGTAYFYMLFFLYPETWSTFIFLCLIPAFSILFFDAKLFYFSLAFNIALITLTFSYVVLVDQSIHYSHIRADLIGNIINFMGSQIILYLIFYMSFDRIKKQQMYYEELQQSERLKTTGQLAAAVAHEIRNPLTVVIGFLQLYKHDQSISEDIKRNFSIMIDELNIAEHVISQFLTIAKPNNHIHLETIDVHKALQSVTDLLMSYGVLNQNDIDLSVQKGLYITANAIEFKQLLINLVKNAIEVSNDGESVFVSAKRKKNGIEIKIIDTGYGMSDEEMKSLGTPFYSLKSKGTGLGLMICYNIVEKYNGMIYFKSKKDIGTTVIVRFPLDSKSVEKVNG